MIVQDPPRESAAAPLHAPPPPTRPPLHAPPLHAPPSSTRPVPSPSPCPTLPCPGTCPCIRSFRDPESPSPFEAHQGSSRLLPIPPLQGGSAGTHPPASLLVLWSFSPRPDCWWEGVQQTHPALLAPCPLSPPCSCPPCPHSNGQDTPHPWHSFTDKGLKGAREPLTACGPHLCLGRPHRHWSVPGSGAGGAPSAAIRPHLCLRKPYWHWSGPGSGAGGAPRRRPGHTSASAGHTGIGVVQDQGQGAHPRRRPGHTSASAGHTVIGVVQDQGQGVHPRRRSGQSRNPW